MKKPLITIYETKSFVKLSTKLIREQGREELQRYLANNPKAGDVIPGGGGIRKLRFARPGMGKRGGVRVIYYFIDERGLITLLTLYAKNDQENLPMRELKLWVEAVEAIRQELEDE
jgi:hypothetical protein